MVGLTYIFFLQQKSMNQSITHTINHSQNQSRKQYKHTSNSASAPINKAEMTVTNCHPKHRTKLEQHIQEINVTKSSNYLLLVFP